MKKRMVSLLLVLAMLLSMCPSFVVHSHAAETNGTIFAVENAWSAVGSTVKVNILVENNTGITYAGLKISWADGLTLVDAENGSVFGDLTYQEPNRYVQSGTNFIWYGNMMNTIEDGVVGTYRKIEDSVVGGYQKIEDSAVNGFRKVSDWFIEKLFSRKGETVEETRKRLTRK